MTTSSDSRRGTDTKLGHLGREPQRFDGAVNPPVYHVSTVLAPDLDTYEAGGRRRYEHGEMVYGRYGTPTHHALESALSELEGAADTVILPSGLAAITCALFAVVRTGDHVLVTDSAYGPTRGFCTGLLQRMGVSTTFYDPTIDPEGLAALIRPETKAMVLEAPGSMTFEVQDVPALAQRAKAAGLCVLMDNTWATPLFFQPIAHGVDLSIQAATKYIVGHADAMLGAVSASDAWARTLRSTMYELGMSAGPDDVYLGMRGLRTLGVRLRQHWRNALTVAEWLRDRPEVAQVLYPALPDAPGHEVWKRDFAGASGLFGVVLAEPYSRDAIAAMLDGMSLFGIGSSWGGYESLMIACYPEKARTATTWDAPGPLLRLHIGLEDPADLIADLEAGFARLTAGG
ncbi:cystathionine beta-lyase [Limimonas halophila]|uniref:Cystathionine beta-lyase n=1 Tax=Limimonas halophila TaxID=1082479 RepID=A0A1G7NE66_9PROT|nr:cystathionine beta-lyase [Limimonas halophila]SDF72323.1 cystathionine beta-lyase [Limimonas halophila]